jgi:hypothetical protein
VIAENYRKRFGSATGPGSERHARHERRSKKTLPIKIEKLAAAVFERYPAAGPGAESGWRTRFVT